jgi:AcrR family transcriptional regulator
MLQRDWTQIQFHILKFERDGLVTRTFRRLDSERQQAVVHAILDEASQSGPTGLAIKDVARRAGVSVGSLYQYFGNRDGLLKFAVALCANYMLDLTESYGQMLADKPLRDAIRDFLIGGVQWGRTEMGLVRFFGRAAYQGDPALTNNVVRPVAEAIRDWMLRLLSMAAERGEIDPDVDLEATARAANAMMIAIGDSQLFPYLNDYYLVSDEAMPVDRVVDAMVDMILKGIAKKN